MMQNNQSTPERFLSTDTLVNRHSNALESSNNFSSEGTISTTSISYESFTSSSIYRDTTAQQQYDSYNTMSK
ncbi:unnamed protein product, partial [Rotaria magnacalcarata]